MTTLLLFATLVVEFPITPSPPSTLLVAGAVALVTITIGAFFAWFAFTASTLSASIEGADLRIHAPVYGRSIPLSHLDESSAAIVDLNESPDLRPRFRTNGIGLPGYSVGWFRLRNGEKALSALTSRNKVLYVRTTEGYSLLLSLVDPERFLSQLSVVTGDDDGSEQSGRGRDAN